ncbi:methyl-accepting chemotaxis protein [Bradyrhizobium niftali]|uniref:HAMP domain-containing protein n=1 Tax=Bradyrhizobium niftali TaxID=2560055 RepID=UPI0038373858
MVQVLAAADAHSEAVETRAEQIRQGLIWGIGFATVLVGLLALMLGRRIATTIGSMTAAMRQLGERQFDVVLPGLGRKDEVGEMAEAIEMFKLKTREKALAELEAKAEQDRATTARRRTEVAQLAGEFEEVVGKVIDSVSSASSELVASARSLTCTADHSRQLSEEVASSSGEASSNVQRVAAATSEMAKSTAIICRRVEEAANMALEAVHKVELSDRRMASLTDAARRHYGITPRQERVIDIAS